MLKCLRLHQTKSTNVFPSIRYKSFTHRSSQHYQSHALFSRNAQKPKLSPVPLAAQRCFHTAGGPEHQSAVAQERNKYESSTLPQSTRVVICGGGVMGGKQ